VAELPEMLSSGDFVVLLFRLNGSDIMSRKTKYHFYIKQLMSDPAELNFADPQWLKSLGRRLIADKRVRDGHPPNKMWFLGLDTASSSLTARRDDIATTFTMLYVT
jgi:hypothetical protein